MMESSTGRLCVIDGCASPVKARNRCNKHYAEARVAGRTCQVEGCERGEYALRFCSTHYARNWATGAPGEAELRRRPPRPCKVAECNNLSRGRNDLCATHYRR